MEAVVAELGHNPGRGRCGGHAQLLLQCGIDVADRLSAADQRAKSLAVADHDAAANGLDDPGTAPKCELLIR